MSLPVDIGFPDNLEISDGYQIVWAAVDPTTGADVSGVVISQASVQATGPEVATPLTLTTGQPVLLRQQGG